jgi:hypothetical protein
MDETFKLEMRANSVRWALGAHGSNNSYSSWVECKNLRALAHMPFGKSGGREKYDGREY